MNLFEIIPQNYFSLFGGKNRAIYVESLMVLYELLESDDTVIAKNDYIKNLKEKEINIEQFSYDDEELDAKDVESVLQNTVSAKAAFICRRLEETGWIDIAMDPNTFEETIILPQYSILIIKAFKDIISDEEAPYLSLVHSTYSELKLEDEERDDFMYKSLLKAYENTKKLKVEMITLTHSIRIFQNKLSKLFEVNNVLHDYFDIYKKKISDRYYHPLKTFDSVARFKRPIVRILDKWLTDREIREKLVNQGLITTGGKTKSEVEGDIKEIVNYITDTYERLNIMIGNIDKENSEYTKSSTNKILYLNNSDKTIKGYLENVLKTYAQNINNPRNLGKILSKMQDSIYFYEQGFIDSQSCTLPILRKYRLDSDPLEVMIYEDMGYLLDDFIEETKSIFTDEKVYGFMEVAFGDKKSINISEIPLPNFDALICVILAIVKKDEESCFYTVEEVDQTKVKSYGYIVPNFQFTRKE